MKPASFVAALFAVGLAATSVGCAADPEPNEDGANEDDPTVSEDEGEVDSTSGALCTSKTLYAQGKLAGGPVSNYQALSQTLLSSACFARRGKLSNFKFRAVRGTYTASATCTSCT